MLKGGDRRRGRSLTRKRKKEALSFESQAKDDDIPTYIHLMRLFFFSPAAVRRLQVRPFLVRRCAGGGMPLPRHLGGGAHNAGTVSLPLAALLWELVGQPPSPTFFTSPPSFQPPPPPPRCGTCTLHTRFVRSSRRVPAECIFFCVLLIAVPLHLLAGACHHSQACAITRPPQSVRGWVAHPSPPLPPTYTCTKASPATNN